MLDPIQFVDESTTPYATDTDFFKTFTDEMPGLYLLSLLLTADNDKAEQCFVSAMGECVEEVGVFMDRTRSWARRAVLKHAIRTIMPAPEHADTFSIITLKERATSAENDPFAEIIALGAFERFVFVMSILEGQSDEECSTLLRCSRRDVMMARVLALKRLANTDTFYGRSKELLQA